MMIYHTYNRTTKAIIMSYLTEAEEKAIDDEEEITIKRGNCSFPVSIKNIYVYGNIDFSKDSEDLDRLSNFDWFTIKDMQGVCIPANYEYETHSCYSKMDKPEYFDTTRAECVCKYVHGFLGHPKRCVIFSHTYGNTKRA